MQYKWVSSAIKFENSQKITHFYCMTWYDLWHALFALSSIIVYFNWDFVTNVRVRRIKILSRQVMKYGWGWTKIIYSTYIRICSINESHYKIWKQPKMTHFYCMPWYDLWHDLFAPSSILVYFNWEFVTNVQARRMKILSWQVNYEAWMRVNKNYMQYI